VKNRRGARAWHTTIPSGKGLLSANAIESGPKGERGCVKRSTEKGEARHLTGTNESIGRHERGGRGELKGPSFR